MGRNGEQSVRLCFGREHLLQAVAGGTLEQPQAELGKYGQHIVEDVRLDVFVGHPAGGGDKEVELEG